MVDTFQLTDRGLQRRPTYDDDVEPDGSHNAAFTETVAVTKANLNVLDVASLILNKMIGTGIFTTPGTILLLNHSKGLTVALWALGGPYCLLCLLVYLDYGTAFPFNGGELIYLNAVWPLPDLLQAFLFAGFFIALGHTAGNSVAFSRHILLAAQDATDPVKLYHNAALTKFVAIIVLGLVCLLLWISPKTGLFLNKLLALYKGILLLVMAIAGMASSGKDCSGAHDSDWQAPSGGINTISGLIYIIYSYTGWENANYIIGDIKTKKRDLRNGAFGAVFLVTILYTLMSVDFFEATSTNAIRGVGQSLTISLHARAASSTTSTACAKANSSAAPPDLGIAWDFSEIVFGHRRGIEICIAISAVGNLVAVAYTSSKVKQAIALHHFLPFSSFFARDDHFLTPGGALLLHWLSSSIFILAMPNNTDGYNFVISLFTYGQLLVGIFIGLGLPRLKGAFEKSKQHSPLDSVKMRKWEPFFSNPALTKIFGALLAIINMVVMIGAAAPIAHRSPAAAPGTAHRLPRYYLPVVLFTILTFALVYWRCFRGLQGRLGKWIGWKVQLAEIEGLEVMDQEQRRDGTEQKFKHVLQEDGRAAKARRRTKQAAKWAEENL